MEQKKRLLNLRLFFIGFVGIILGILSFYELLNVVCIGTVSFWFILFIVLFVSVIALLIYVICKKTVLFYLKYFIAFILLFVVGFLLFAGEVNSVVSNKNYDGVVSVEGIVDDFYSNDKNFIINIHEARLNGDNKVDNVKLYVIIDNPLNENLSIGDLIKFESQVSGSTLIGDKINISALTNNQYVAYTMSSSITVIDKEPNIIDSIKIKLREILDIGLTDENADIVYATLVGEKDGLDNDVKRTFSYAGISHILAVSGLHVGFIVVLFMFILGLFKIDRRWKFILTSIALLLYCLLCGFNPSVLRASFMSIIMLLAKVIGDEYDSLNALSIAGILILLVSPVDLLNLGFQLSFVCVFMIITLADRITKCLVGWRIPKTIASPVSISLCTTIGTSLIIANTFNELSLLGVITNLIVIPLFSLVYPLMFIIAMIGTIIPVIAKLLFIPEILLHLIKLIASVTASIEIASFRVFDFGYLVFFLFLIFAFQLKYLMCNIKTKTIVSIVSIISCIIVAILGLIPTRYNSYSIHTCYQYNTNSAVLTTDDGKKYLIGIDDFTTENLLNEMKILRIDAWILYDFEVNKISQYVDFLKWIDVEYFVIPKNPQYVDKVFNELNNYTTIMTTDEYLSDVSVHFIKTKTNVVAGVDIKTNNKHLLFTNGITKAKLETIGLTTTRYDYIFTNDSKYDFSDFGIGYDRIICSNTLNFETNKAILLKNKAHYVLELY